MKLVSEPFDRTGFSNWKRSVTIALSAINKLGFVDGSLPNADISSTSFKSWSRSNDMVISWLLGALSKTIGRNIIYAIIAHQIWLELEERYGMSNGTQMFGLHKELNELSQGNNNIVSFDSASQNASQIDSTGSSNIGNYTASSVGNPYNQGINSLASTSQSHFTGLSPELCNQLVTLIKSAQVSDYSTPSSANFCETQFSTTVKIVRTDSALELGLRNAATTFFLSKGIIHQTFCAYTPQQNGVVEKKHKHLLETTRAFLFQ
ncbi:hypothetical protein AgCh_039061 [Apium graveolens]